MKNAFPALLLLTLFVSALAVGQYSGLLSMTVWTTANTYPGDTVSITFASSTTTSCDLSYYIEYVVINQADKSKQWTWKKYFTGDLAPSTMVSHTTSWVAQDAGLYEARGVVVCSIKDQYGFYPRITPVSSYTFTINEKPLDITCTNECNILGSRDIPYGQCPYKKCGYYDADPCLEWSAPITDSTCLPQNTICINGVCINEVSGPCTTDAHCVTTPPVTCLTDTYQCPDGSYVSRNIDDNCNFDLCPEQMCDSIWKTGVWSECKSDGFQVRQVYDLNNCAEPTGVMPQNKQSCTPDFGDQDPVCGTFKKISESDCHDGQMMVYYENACGDETENLENCTSQEFFDQKTLIMIGVVFLVLVAVMVYKKK